MCGRFTNTANPNSIQIRFDIEAEDLELVPRYNIAPTQEVPIVVEEEGQRKLRMMRWGLIPGWAKEASIGNRMINARLETLSQKPAFKRYFQKSRCLVPADGFYEWKKLGKEKRPMRIVLKSRQLFGMAGLWTKWRDAEGKEIRSFTIVTTNAEGFIRKIHDRMPLILQPENEAGWLNAELQEVEKIQPLLLPFSTQEMEAYQVSKEVNNPRNESEGCIKPLEE